MVYNTYKYPSVFAENLESIISSNGVTQEMLADAIGVQRQTISKYTKGLSTPSVDIALKIANYFNVSLDWLCGRENAYKELSEDKSVACKTLGLSSNAIDSIMAIAKMPADEEVFNTSGIYSSFAFTKGANLELYERERQYYKRKALETFKKEFDLAKKGIEFLLATEHLRDICILLGKGVKLNDKIEESNRYKEYLKSREYRDIIDALEKEWEEKFVEEDGTIWADREDFIECDEYVRENAPSRITPIDSYNYSANYQAEDLELEGIIPTVDQLLSSILREAADKLYFEWNKE